MKNKWHFRSSHRGSTLVEVLVSFAILATTGVFVSGFLYKSSVTQKAWNENYGQELAKITLLTENPAKDTIFTHIDAKGVNWEILVKCNQDEDEVCHQATPVRNKADTTRALYFCRYTPPASAKARIHE